MKNYIVVNEQFLEDYIISSLERCFKDSKTIEFYKYHHNARYKDAPSIIKNGILPIRELLNKKIINLSDREITYLSDEDNHVNGIDGVSLSVVGLNDMSRKEDVYDPYLTDVVDFLISDKVIARRKTGHYGNEFVTYESIEPSKLVSIDIRILKLVKECIKHNKIDKLIEIYNSLIEIGRMIVEEDSKIQLREMSNAEYIIDPVKLADKAKIIKYNKF